jgi:putative (di)nucleoside polyphosphate hydrolase
MDGAGQLFLGRRAGGKGWQFPQGGMRHGESAEESLYRELLEETGLASADVQLLASTGGWLRYRLPARYVRRDQRPLCIGQKQRWFLLKLLAEESAVRFDLNDQPEFDRWRWVDYWQPVKEVIYFKRPVYVRALHELAVARPQGLPAYPGWWARYAGRGQRSSDRGATRPVAQAAGD